MKSLQRFPILLLITYLQTNKGARAFSGFPTPLFVAMYHFLKFITAWSCGNK